MRITSLCCNGLVPIFYLADDLSQVFCRDACSFNYDGLRGSTVSCEIVDRL